MRLRGPNSRSEGVRGATTAECRAVSRRTRPSSSPPTPDGPRPTRPCRRTAVSVTRVNTMSSVIGASAPDAHRSVSQEMVLTTSPSTSWVCRAVTERTLSAPGTWWAIVVRLSLHAFGQSGKGVRSDRLATVTSCRRRKRVPVPGKGATWDRWRYLAAMGGVTWPACDSGRVTSTRLRILDELGRRDVLYDDGAWGVWRLIPRWCGPNMSIRCICVA